MKANHRPKVSRADVVRDGRVDELAWVHGGPDLHAVCLELRAEGYTAEAIGLVVGRSKNRVCQILNAAEIR